MGNVNCGIGGVLLYIKNNIEKFRGPKGDKGDTGDDAGFGTPTATIDNNVGTPSVSITTSGNNTNKVFNFVFKNLKGQKGDKGDKGDRGATGATGPQGPKGDTGNAGVTGVKGNAETSYRTNNVNLTPVNIGAYPITGGSLNGNIIALNTNAIIYSTTTSSGYKTAGAINIFCKDWDQEFALSMGAVNGLSNALTIMPYTDNIWYLGHINKRFKSVYAVTGTIQTSDRNYKEKIEKFDDDFVRNFIMGLLPVHYKLKDADTGRTHFGMISQDIEKLLSDLNVTSMDFAGFIKSPKTKTIYHFEDYEEEVLNKETGQTETVTKTRISNIEEVEIPGEYIYSLRYDEFISPLIRMVQLQQEQINELKNRLDNHLKEE